MENSKNIKDETKEEQVNQKLSEDDLKGVSGGFKFHKHERNPTQVPISEPLDDWGFINRVDPSVIITTSHQQHR